MKAHWAVLLVAMFLVSSSVSCCWVNSWWMKHKDDEYPVRGDFDYYVDATAGLPANEHPVVPAMLFTVNLAVRNPTLTVLGLMVAGFVLIHFLVGWVVYNATGHKPLASASFLAAVWLSDLYPFWGFLLKNVWAIVFCLACMGFAVKIANPKLDWKLAAVVGLAVATGLTHSAPVWLLLEVLAAYTVFWAVRSRKVRMPMLVAGLLAAVTLFSLSTLAWTGRLGKLTSVFSYMRNPLWALFNNLWNLTNRHFLPYYTMYLTASATTFVGVLKRRFNPLLLGLALALATAYFTPPQGMWPRLYVTATPLLVLFFFSSIPQLYRMVKE